MALKALPIDVISLPNYYSPSDGNRWEIASSAITLNLQLQIDDNLGQRRYVAASGAVLKVTFYRADLIQNTGSNYSLVNTGRDVVKTCAVNANDRSLWSVALTSQDVGNIVSGSTVWELTEGATVTTWQAPYSIYKKQVGRGF